MDVAAKKFTDLTDFDGIDSWPMWSRDGFIYFVSDRDGNGLTNIWRVPEKRRQGRAGHHLQDRRRALAGDQRRRQDDRLRARLRRLEARRRRAEAAAPLKLDIAAETQENLTEIRDFNSAGGRLRPRALRPPHRLLDSRRDLHRADRGRRPRQITDGAGARPGSRVFARRQVARLRLRPERPRGDLRRGGRRRRRAEEDHRPRRAEVVGYAWSPDSKAIAFTTSDGKLRHVSTSRRRRPRSSPRRSTATSARPSGRPTASGSPIRRPTTCAPATST